MAHFDLAKIGLVWLILAIPACSPPPPQPTPPSAAPVPKEYVCEFNRKAAGDFRTLPATSPIRIMVDDYRIERKALRGFHNLPDPPPCPP